MRHGQRTFRPDNKQDRRHSCFIVVQKCSCRPRLHRLQEEWEP